jgi:hypothetical protein
MTQTTYDPATVDPNDVTVVWTPQQTSDNGLWLCTPHAIREYNGHPFVALGIAPRASTLAEVRMSSTETGEHISFDGHAADADHACVACKAGDPLNLDPYADETSVTDEAAAGELAEVLQFVNPTQDKTSE